MKSNIKIENKNATLADGVFEAPEGTRLNGPRLGTLPSINVVTCLSSEENGTVEKVLLEPTEGVEPSVPRIPSLGPYRTAGYPHPTMKFFIPVLICFFFIFLSPSSASASATFASPDPSNTSGQATGLVGYWSMDASTINWATGVVRDLSGKGK
jgi:hypothetical protein